MSHPYPPSVAQQRRAQQTAADMERLLAFIIAYHRDNGFAPSIREMCEAVGKASTSVVNYRLGKLELAGKIQRAPGVARGIRIVATPARAAKDA